MAASNDKPIRVAVTYRVCQHWRAHIFAKLNAREDLELAVFHGQSVPGTKCINGENLQGFEHFEHWTINVPKAKGWVFQPFMFFSLRKYKPDVILAEGGSNLLTNFPVFLYARLFGKPVIWWTLGELRGATFNGPIKKVYRFLVVMQEKMSSVYLGYSTVAREYFKKMKYPEADSFVAVNCVDTNRVFQNIDERQHEAVELRAELGLDEKKVILFVGALTPAKRVDRLIRVFQKIAPKLPDTELVIVGDGVSASSLKEMSQELGIEDRVTFTGAVVLNVSDYYELGSVFVLPGLGGLAISEAMAHELPVICTVADGCEVDLVAEGETGFRLFSDVDVEVEEFLEQKLLKCLSDHSELNRLSENSKDRIVSVHNVNTYLGSIVDAIKHAYKKSRSRRS